MILTRRQRTLLGFQKGERQPPNDCLYYDKKTQKLSCETPTYNLIISIEKWPVVILDYLHYHGDEKGWGARKFRDLLSNWIHLGASEILIPHAKGKLPRWSGYYVWPRFGFEGKPHWKTVSSMPCGKLKAGLEKTKSLRWLFGQSGGPQFWLRYGSSVRQMRFDLSPGSPNLEAWREYWDAHVHVQQPGGGEGLQGSRRS